MAYTQPWRIVVLVAVLALGIAAGSVLGSRPSPSVPFFFEQFEWFFGLAKDEAAAADSFQKRFPIGTPLGEIESFFAEIGGECFMLPLDRPGQLICVYHRQMLPFLPSFSTWAVTVWFDDAKSVTAIKVTGGAEGP